MPPAKMSNEEQTYWTRIENLIGNLLDELKKNGYLRNEAELAASTPHVALGQLLEIAGRFNGHMATSRMLDEAFTTKNAQLTNCLKSLGVGFDEDNVANTWAYDMISVFIESTEMLKNHLLVAIKSDKSPFKPRMTLGQLFHEMEKVCPLYGKQFANEVNVGLRNAFSHELYWMKRQATGIIDLHYVEELGGKETSTPLRDIMTVFAKQELLTTCLEETLGKRAQSGYFK